MQALHPQHWMVDAMNVVGCRPDGWWRDRRGALERLVAQLDRWVSQIGEPVTVVLEQRPVPPIRADAVEIAWGSQRGPDSADEEIVGRLRRTDDPTRFRVVTSDRGLADRARRLGATVEPARAFRRRLERADQPKLK